MSLPNCPVPSISTRRCLPKKNGWFILMIKLTTIYMISRSNTNADTQVRGLKTNVNRKIRWILDIEQNRLENSWFCRLYSVWFISKTFSETYKFLLHTLDGTLFSPLEMCGLQSYLKQWSISLQSKWPNIWSKKKKRRSELLSSDRKCLSDSLAHR